MQLLQTQTILNGPSFLTATLIQILSKRSATRSYAEREAIAVAFASLGALTSIGNLVPFCQAAHETAWFSSDRWTKSYNPAGLGATNDGSWGGHFDSPIKGILAQFAHLLNYTMLVPQMDMFQASIVRFDPRTEAMAKSRVPLFGLAPRWVDLNGKWAVPGKHYGETILDIANNILGSYP